MKLEGVVTHGIKLNAVGCVSNEVVIAFGPIGSYVDMSQFYTMEQTDALLDDKADKVDTYTKDETDALLDTKADKSTTYTKNEVDEMMSNVDTEPTEGSTNFVTSGGVFNALGQKVNVVPGKGLSSHDFTSAYKTKLIGIEEGAEKNIIERIYANGNILPVENKGVNIPAATNTMAGVMSASDKRKLNEMTSALAVNVTGSNGVYEADRTLTELDIAITQGRDVLYIVNHSDYYRMSFYVPTQCVIAVRMNLNEPMMDSAKASYLYHSITGVTVNSVELADATDIPTNLSDLTNDVGFITSQALANYADGAEYDSTTHYIYLKHGNTRLPNPINAADFIKDGMVETVTVGKPATGPNAGVDCLIVTFNTDAGESPIELPLTRIFDPTNYYTKTEVDTALGGKANSDDLASVATSGSYNDLSDKPDIPQAQVQSDWNESDSSKVDYIKNKPTIPTVPTNVSAFTNDVGYLTTETDPTVPNHVKGITQQNITSWNGKADVFTINCVYDGTSITSCDKTFAEISSAHNSGKILNVVINNGYAFGRLNQVASDAFYFNVVDTIDFHWIISYELEIKSDNTYSIIVSNLNLDNYLNADVLDYYYTKTEVNSAIVDSNPVIEDGRTSDTQSVVGVAPFASLVDGQRILLAKLKYSLVAKPTLTLTLSNGTNTAAIPMYCDYAGGPTLKTNWGGIIKKGGAIGLIYDGTNNRWIALSHLDTNTTYAAMTQANLETGTSTNSNVVSVKLLRDNFYLKSEINTTIGDIETLLASI